MHILNSPILGHEGGLTVPGNFPGLDGDGATGTPRTIDLGMGLIGVLDESGTLVSVRQAPQAPVGPFTGITEGQRQQISSQERISGAGIASSELMARNQLAQLDRQLAATIKQQEADLAEKRRQFDISTGLARERLAAEIKIAERQLQSNRQISQMDARTRLAIAQQANVTTRRGQRLDLATRRADLGARRAEFAAGALGNDEVRQAIFLLGGSGGTSPLEMAAQTFPTLDFEFGPETGEFDINALTQLPQMEGGGRVRPGEAVEVHDDEIVVNRGDGTMVVIPVTESAQGGGQFGMTPQAGTEAFPLASILRAPEEARKTFSGLLGDVFSAGSQPAFGGTGAEMEPLFGVDLKLPSQLAAVFPRLPVAVQNIIRSALGVRGINPQEFRRRRLAATPNPVFSGMVGVRP